MTDLKIETVTKIPLSKFSNQHDRQPIYLYLDRTERRVWIDYCGIVGAGMPMAVYNGTLLRWELPLTLPEVYNEVLNNDGLRKCLSALIDDDISGDERGHLDEEIATYFHNMQTLTYWDAADWFEFSRDDLIFECRTGKHTSEHALAVHMRDICDANQYNPVCGFLDYATKLWIESQEDHDWIEVWHDDDEDEWFVSLCEPDGDEIRCLCAPFATKGAAEEFAEHQSNLLKTPIKGPVSVVVTNELQPS